MNTARTLPLVLAAAAGALLVTLPRDASAWRQCAISATPVPGGTEADWSTSGSLCSRTNTNTSARTIIFALPVETSTIQHTVSVWGRGTSSAAFSAKFVSMDQHGVIQFTTPIVTSALNTSSQNLALASITPAAGQGCALYVEVAAGANTSIDEVTWVY